MPTKKGHGKYIDSPSRLLELFEQFKKWCEENPILKHDYVGQLAEQVYKKLDRPITFGGFELWLYENMIISQLTSYERDPAYSEYLPVIKHIKGYCKENMINGALVGIFKENLTARLHGLTEKTESKNETEIKGDLTINFKNAE